MGARVFVHLVKDYLKKLEDLAQRLETSLDKDEIQTLGLKLRFHYNEVRHYRQLLDNVFNKVVEIQEKFGFATGEDAAPAASPPPHMERVEVDQPAEMPVPSPAPRRNERAGEESRHKQLTSLVTRWIRQLDAQGVDVEEMFVNPGRFDEMLRERAEGFDMTLPGEEPEEDAEAPAGGAETAGADGYAGGEYPGGEDTPEYIDEEQPVGVVGLEPDEAPQYEDRTGAAIHGRLEEWESAIGAGDVEQVIDLVRKFVEHNRSECLGYVASVAAQLPGRVDSSAKSDFLHALIEMLLGNYGSSINLFEGALRKAGYPPETNFILAGCYFQKGLYENAMVNYTRSAAAGINRFESTIEATECLLRLGRFREVIDILDKAGFETRDHVLHAGMRKIDALVGLRAFDEAVVKSRALLDECETPTERSLCYHLTAKAKEAKGDIVDAIDLYERSLENDSMNAPARLALGKLCLDNQAAPLAKNHLTFVARNFPESEWADEARRLLYDIAGMAARLESADAGRAAREEP